tara:strand:- start:5499 stop:5738 length:240 start_codon:yes stop_codon:yes gene_type:complete
MSSQDISKKELVPLTTFQIRQKKFLIEQYPLLDDMMVDTIVRLSVTQVESIVCDMKSGKLENEEKRAPEDYVLKAVDII